jgi:hypothetical protein
MATIAGPSHGYRSTRGAPGRVIATGTGVYDIRICLAVIGVVSALIWTPLIGFAIWLLS